MPIALGKRFGEVKRPGCSRPPHCEELLRQSAPAFLRGLDCFASLAMTWRGCSLRASVVDRRWLVWAGVARDPQAPILVGDVDIAAGVDEDVLGLVHDILRQGTGIPGGLRRNEPAGLDRHDGGLNVEDPPP